jgi:sarcosine oxidase subunit beta
MPWRLLKLALQKQHRQPRFFPQPCALKPHYDVVIIGAGGHGLACAYYLAREHGITDVAVLEQGYLGGGNTGRNTTIVRSNYLTPEGVKFYDTSLKLFEDLAGEFDLNIFYSTRGHFTLAHSDSAMRTMRWRAEVNKHYGIDSEVVDRQTIHEQIPALDLDCGGDQPVLGALWHAPGAVVRHDAVAWGYGRGAATS